jgi:hypothetical protein
MYIIISNGFLVLNLFSNEIYLELYNFLRTISELGTLITLITSCQTTNVKSYPKKSPNVRTS